MHRRHFRQVCGRATLTVPRTPYGRTRWGHLPPQHRTVRARVPTVDLTYAAVDIARHNGALAGTVAADFALGKGVHRKQIAKLAGEMINYPRIETARWAAENADGRTESPLETLGRLAFLTNQRQAPLTNVSVSAGPRRYRVDHLLPDAGVVSRQTAR